MAINLIHFDQPRPDGSFGKRGKSITCHQKEFFWTEKIICLPARPNVRFGAKMSAFAPNSGHWMMVLECPLWAKSGH
jgi:hypothetical protein